MINAVLFDLDGTLADTAPDLGLALNRLLDEEGRSRQQYSNIRPVASHGTRGLIELGFGIGPQHPDFPRLRSRFLALYEQCYCEETRLFEGIDTLLQVINERGLAWGIITNKPARFTDLLVGALPLFPPPAVVVSGDTVGAAKPDPRPMYHAAELLGIAPENCLYVGDAERDIVAGRRVGMTTVLADYGYISASDNPHEWGADIRIANPLELIAHLPD
ncbi:MAG: phosphoglycolate phosphatase [Proteobacteria bacterium]|nr:phosphoglycolate phosphatase [Pseudomonadota bacterium]